MEKQAKTNISEQLVDYVKTRANIILLKVAEKAALVISGVIAFIIFLILFFFVLTIVSIGLSILMGEVTGSLYKGFLIVGGIHIIILLLLYFNRRKLLYVPFANMIVRLFFKK
jgi:hypothetical protein